MKTDTPPAQLHYFLQEEIYLLKADKALYQSAPQPQDSIVEPTATAAAIIVPGTTSATPQTDTVATETPAIKFNYLGGNQKKFLVLVHYPAADFMVAEHLTALTGTLTRINFMQDDVAIVNMAKAEEKDWKAISKFFAPQKLLVLGAKAMPANISAIAINVIQNTGNIPVLYTFGFDEMMGNKDNTRIFWNLIKTF